MVKLHKELLAVIAAIVLSLGSAAGAEGWRGGATAPRPGLPPVEIVLGYPGGYVPRNNSPIEIRARSGAQGFDGHIGYHFAAGGNMTVDVPVIARAVIPPRSQWSFSTTLQMVRSPQASVEAGYLTKRELVIEWLDANLTLIAQQTVGVPPWVEEPQPLRILWPDEQLTVSTYLGSRPAVIEVASLSTVPQWYAGFSDVVVPFARWLELPAAIREAVFRSGVHVVFFGIPDGVPAMTAIDRALLPIELRPAASRVDVPWPYGDAQIAAAVSWQAKKGAQIAGSSESPYLVTNDAATFAAEEKAVLVALPSSSLIMPMGGDVGPRAQPTAAELVREHRPAIVFAIALLLSVVMWIAFRRTQRAALLAVVVIAALAMLGWRSVIHAPDDTGRLERRVIAAPGIVDVLIVRGDYGGTPRRVASQDVAAEARRVTARPDHRVGGDSELRTAQTPPGFGQIDAPNRAWLMTTRVSKWRELGEPAAIRIRSRDANQLVVEYRSKESFNYIAAEWAWNGEMHYGESPIHAGQGNVTIRSTANVWPHLGNTATGRTTVVLSRVERGRTSSVRQFDPEDMSGGPRSYINLSALRTDANGKLSALFLLPGPVPPDAAVSVAFPMFGVGHTSKPATLSGPGGSVTFNAKWTGRLPIAADISASDIQRIAPAGGIVRVETEPSGSASGTSEATASLRVREKSQ